MMQLADIKNTIISRLNSLPFKIKLSIIYGSAARGTFTPDSDIDILFVSDEINPKRHRRGEEIGLIKECLSLGHPLDILLLTSNEFESRKIDAGWKEKLIWIAGVSSEVEPEVTWSRYPGIDKDTLWIPIH